jgi:hypothetical protein
MHSPSAPEGECAISETPTAPTCHAPQRPTAVVLHIQALPAPLTHLHLIEDHRHRRRTRIPPRLLLRLVPRRRTRQQRPRPILDHTINRPRQLPLMRLHRADPNNCATSESTPGGRCRARSLGMGMSAWLGHASKAFTMQTYVHSQPEALNVAARSFGGAFASRNSSDRFGR